MFKPVHDLGQHRMKKNVLEYSIINHFNFNNINVMNNEIYVRNDSN